jgi:hypothetical protein
MSKQRSTKEKKKKKKEPTQVLANVLNLKDLSRPFPLAVRDHFPPDEAMSDDSATVNPASSEPVENIGFMVEYGRPR